MPFDSQAQRESLELGNEAGDTRASLAAKFAAAQDRLGFGGGSANPYSDSAENKQDLTNTNRGIANTAGNSLYAGSTLNARSQARSQYDKNQKAIEGAYSEATDAYTGGLAQTGRDESLGGLAIKEGAIGRAAATEPAPLAVGRGRGRAASKAGRGKAPQPVRVPRQTRGMIPLMGAGVVGRRGRGRV